MVIGIIGLLSSILVPALGRVRRQVRSIVGASNQRQVAGGVTLFSMDNDGSYPESVATVGFGSNWNWSDPMKMAGNRTRSPGMHRAMSEYLGGYIDDAGVMFCPNAPRQYTYLQESWDAGDKGLDEIQIKLHAGYTDGHVESYSANEVTTMKVSITSDGSVPYPTGVGAGDFYLPRNCLP